MQENNFEKQVRELMDDLQITPSTPVWDYVEKRIPKSNRRRRFIAFFLLFAGIALCGYFFYNKLSTDKNQTANNTIAEARNSIPEKNIVDTLNIIHDDGGASSTTLNNAVNDKNEKNIPPQHEQRLTTAFYEEKNKTAETANDTEKENQSTPPAISKTGNEKIITTIDTGLTESLLTQTEKEITSEPTTNQKINDTAQTVILQEPVSTITDNLKPGEANEQKKKIKNPLAISKKLQWGVSAFYGKVDIVEHLASFGDDKSYLQDGSLNAGNGGGYPVMDSADYISQSRNIKAKAAFSIGVAVKKQLTQKSSIITGISFEQRRTEIQTGTLKDSSANFNYNNSSAYTLLSRFYSPGMGTKHTNTYTLLQLPVLYSYQFNKSKRLPLTVDAGFSIARILSSNALVYDSYNQAYYKNEELLHKTQVHLVGGVNIDFRVSGKNNLSVGPQFQYGLTSIIKNNSIKQHFFAWGLQAKYFIKR